MVGVYGYVFKRRGCVGEHCSERVGYTCDGVGVVVECRRAVLAPIVRFAVGIFGSKHHGCHRIGFPFQPHSVIEVRGMAVVLASRVRER